MAAPTIDERGRLIRQLSDRCPAVGANNNNSTAHRPEFDYAGEASFHKYASRALANADEPRVQPQRAGMFTE